MTRARLALAVAALLAAPAASPQPEIPRLVTTADVRAALEALIRRHYPAAEISVTATAFSASAGTMPFTLHRIYRDASISRETYRAVGPGRDGFALQVSYSTGRYTGPLATPQTLREPYWSTFVNEVAAAGDSSHLWVSCSYGAGVKKEFHERLLWVLRASRRRTWNRAAPAEIGAGRGERSAVARGAAAGGARPRGPVTRRSRRYFFKTLSWAGLAAPAAPAAAPAARVR